MDRHIFLIGMMGCGKSTLGCLLAGGLHCGFIDLDEEIVRFEGRSIPEIFAADGDAGFRLCETAALRRALHAPPCVIATGGGIITRGINAELMRQSGTVVWLNRPLEAMIADVRQDTRPNLAGDKEARMRTLFSAREPLYRAAAHLEFANVLPPAQAADALLTLLARGQDA